MFYAKISINKKNIVICNNRDEYKCAIARDKYIVDNKIGGKLLNFPELFPEYYDDKNRIIKTKCIDYDKDKNAVKLLLKNDVEAIIDRNDYDKIKFYHCEVNKDGYVYINFNSDYKTKSVYKIILLHRYLMKPQDHMCVDHINGIKTDNRRCNLREITYGQNSQNVNHKKKENSTSQYIGVIFKSRAWKIQIANNCQIVKFENFNNNFDNEENAARARDLYIILKINSYHKLNFDWTDTNDVIFWNSKLNIVSNEDALEYINNL